jgi:hypothetical protein
MNVNVNAKRSKARWSMVAILLGAVTLLGRAGWAQEAQLDIDGLGKTDFGRMHMLLEKTFLNVDVLTVEIRLPPETAESLRTLAAGQKPNAGLTDRIAARAYRAEDAYVEIRFKRNVSLDEFVAAVRKNLERARKASMIDEETYQNVSRNLPHWFAFLQADGIKSGDRILYRARPASMRTLYVDQKGRIRLDQTDEGAGPRLALLGGYFAPGSEFKDKLVASLFDR